MVRSMSSVSARHRKQAAGLVAFAVLYSCAGFFGAPLLLKKLGEDYVRDTLRLQLSVSGVEVNPWTLAIRLDDLSVNELDGKSLLALKSLYVNLDSFSTIWRRQLAVDELDVLEPVVNARIDPAGKLNLLALVPPDDPEDQGQTPWHIATLGIHRGHVELRDESRPVPFTSRLEPLELSLYNLDSKPDGSGQYHFEAETGKGEYLAWKGSLALNPVRSEGYLAVKGLQATTIGDYLQNQLPVVIRDGKVSLSGHYRMRLEHEIPDLALSGVVADLEGFKAETVAPKPLSLSLDRVSLREMSLEWPVQSARLAELILQGMTISGQHQAVVSAEKMQLLRAAWRPEPGRGEVGRFLVKGIRFTDGAQTPLLVMPELEVAGAAVQPSSRQLETGAIHIKEGQARFTRYTDTDSDWLRFVTMLAAAAEDPSPMAATEAAAPWRLALGELSLSAFKADIEDRVPPKPVSMPLFIKRFSVQPEMDLQKPHRFDGELDIGRAGGLTLAGEFNESPLRLSGRAELHGFDLRPITPYLADFARFQLESGRLGFKGNFSIEDAGGLKASYQGAAGIEGFAANDLFLQERFLAWKRLQLDGVDFNLEPLRLKVREIAADQPFSRLMILPDKSLNVIQILASAPTPSPIKVHPPKAAKPPVMEIGRIRVSNGSMLFADLSLKPQFATGIESLSGEIRQVSNRPGAIATVQLNGRVDQYGKADIRGQLNPLAPDDRTALALKFDNVELTTLTPYSAKFAGYRIDQGKLSLDLNYRIDNRRLQAENHVVLNQLTLGGKVDSPDAVNMPLRLALALLRDSKGVIDLDLPISGSLDDPQFRVGPIVWKAFVNVVTKVASAPFRFIAGLVNGGEDIDRLPFLPGSVDVSPEARERAQKLAAALVQRPQLRIELRGIYDAVLDRQALQNSQLEAALKAVAVKAGKSGEPLELLYLEKFGAESLKQKKVLAQRPAGGQDLTTAPEAYRASLRAALLEREAVADGDLRQLALDRSRALRRIMIDEGKVEDARVFVLEPEAATAVDGRVVTVATLNAQ